MKGNIDIINRLIVNIFSTIMLIEEKVLKSGKFSDLSVTEFHTLEAIGKKHSRTMSEVAKDLKITVGTLTTAINRLVKKGYVNRKREETDRRIVKVSLSKKGQMAFDEHNRFHKEMVKGMVKDLDLETQQVIIESLGQIKNFIKDNYKDVLKQKRC